MVIKYLEYLKEAMVSLNINLDKAVSILKDIATIEKDNLFNILIDVQVENGKNYWQSYAEVNFPIVSIDLKQIYGRIIRTEYDYGSLFIMSKFHSDNSAVIKLATQLHGVPIIRKYGDEIFEDLKMRVTRWK